MGSALNTDASDCVPALYPLKQMLIQNANSLIAYLFADAISEKVFCL